jgi:hypothetical protein
MPTGELAAIQSLIINIIQRISGATKMEMTNTASDLWDNLYPEISKDHPGLIGSVINRAEAQIMRLAITYALIDNKYNIDTPHLKAALAFWEYAEASAKYIFSRHDESSPFEKIVTSLRSGEKTKTELHQTFGNGS